LGDNNGQARKLSAIHEAKGEGGGMPAIGFELPIIILLVLANGVFAMAEHRMRAALAYSLRRCLEVERERILRVLRDTQGIIRGPHGATARFGLRRTTERYKMEKLDISRQPQ
jgi:hypothetical protein